MKIQGLLAKSWEQRSWGVGEAAKRGRAGVIGVLVVEEYIDGSIYLIVKSRE